ncbi:hypothetical protein niasHT_015869 [Heterodera trifolii]|uniref:Uncharacterized protein n=1 Tax=Heterodera trifolii TaxID=157864 RepID=A0ABD2LE74_9BILA
MPATKKKAQLDPLVRRSIALLWAYNGSDLVLLTFLPGECRFDEYCQANRKNFRVLSLGTWFSIKYQHYVKCETRINVLDVSVLVEKPPFETRVIDAVVQLCVPFVCLNANPYTDQYTYKSSLGNIVLRKSQGGGPNQLLIWCSLQTVAWWKDPMLAEVVIRNTDERKVAEERDGFGGRDETTAKGIATPTNDKSASVWRGFKPNNKAKNSCEPKRNDADNYESGFEQRSDGRFKRWHSQNTETNGTKEANGKKANICSDASSLCDSWGECVDDEIDVDPDFDATNECVDGDEFVASKEKEGRKNEKLEEEYKWSHYDTTHSFDWQNLNVGIVVERVEMPPNEQMDTILFSVFPLCSGERYPGILRLWTRRCLQTGQWISFRKSWSPFGSLNDGEYCAHPPMFRTLSFLGRVVVECEIIFPNKQGDEIRTTWDCPQNHLDEHGLYGQRFLGTRRWAVLEHVPMDWSPTKSWWKIVHVRPIEFEKLFKN